MALTTVEIGSSNPKTLFGDGVVDTPSIGFTADPDTGLYRTASGEVSFTSNGTRSLSFGATGLITGAAATASLTLAGAVTGGAAAQRDIVFRTGNAANPQVLATRLTIGSNAATSVITWANATHTGIVLSGALDVNGQALNNILSANFDAVGFIGEDIRTSYLTINGGTNVGGGGALLLLEGSTTGGTLFVRTPNAAADGDVTRVQMSGVVAVSALTISASNVLINAPATGIALSVRGQVQAGLAGTTQGTVTIEGVTSGVVTVAVAAAAGTWTMTLPTGVPGTTGDQLSATTGGVCSWTAAGSLREFKHILGVLDPRTALSRILSTPVELWTYRRDAKSSTGDFETTYAGVVADKAPWAMHYEGRIFSPASAFGHAAAAIQALYAEIADLKTQLAALQS